MEATLCATSEVHAERVRRHTGVLAQPRSHSLGEKKTIFDLTTTLYVLHICLMYYMRNRSEVSGAEVRRSEGSKRSESGVRDSEVRGVVVRRFEYRFQPSQNRYVTPDHARRHQDTCLNVSDVVYPNFIINRAVYHQLSLAWH